MCELSEKDMCKLRVNSVAPIYKFKILGSLGPVEGDNVRAVGTKSGQGWREFGFYV